MASYQYLFILAFLTITTSPLLADARDSQFFSKVSRTDPKAETGALSPSASTSPFTKAATEKGYGLFAKDETYEYPPTTTNPTKSKPAEFKPEEANNGNVKLEESNEGHESFYGNQYHQGERYETGEKQGNVYYGGVQKQGMSDTRFLENGKYFHDIEAEERSNNNRYSNNAAFYNNNDKYTNEAEEEEEGGGEKYGSELYGTEEEQGRSDTYYSPRGRYNGKSNEYEGERFGRKQGNVYGRQGMSDTRFLENGKYFYDIEAERKRSNDGYSNNVALYDNSKYKKEAPNGAEFYDSGKSNEYYGKERYEPEKASYSYGKYSAGKGYDFKSTANRFPKYEFDSMEEYEKYEQGRSHQNEYAP